MENIMQTLDENYIWVIVIAIFVLFTVIGFFVDRSQSKKRKNKEEKIKKDKKEDKTIETKEEIIKEPQIVEKEEPFQNTISERITLSDNKEMPKKEFDNDDTGEMSNTFLKEENYDLRNLMKESITESKEKATSVEEPKQNETEVMSATKERMNKDNYDRNLEYLLKEKEKPKEEIESIDDFLQRTMREAYQPTPEVEEKKESVNIEPAKESNSVEKTTVDIDYEDTLPIPIQREDDFSPLEVTVVDPEFYKEYTAKPIVEKKESKITEQKDIDFKPIEDAILESLGRLSENEEQKDI